jgi:hypothetical protein
LLISGGIKGLASSGPFCEEQMAAFEEAWSGASISRDGEAVSPLLRPFLNEVYVQVLAEPKNLPALKNSLVQLLTFLAGEGRSNANCWAADLFFCRSDGWVADWSDQGLPDEFHDVLARMGEALHDTVRAKHIAENFGCLPEQLLDRVSRIDTDGPRS